MMRFKEFQSLKEGKYPVWLKFVTGGIVMKMRNLSNQIQNENDPVKQNKLISQQNTLLSYITGLGIGVSSNSPQIMTRFKKGLTVPKGKGRT